MALHAVPDENAIQVTLDATLAASATSLTTDSDISGKLSNVSASRPGVLVVDRVDSNGTATPSKREYCTFTGATGTTISGLTRAQAGSSDQEHAVGAVVEFVPDVVWAQSIEDTILVGHSDAGAHNFTQLDDASGNEVVEFGTTASAVNHVKITNAATGNGSTIESLGGDANVDLLLKAKGTGVVKASRSVSIQVVEGATDTATGDGQFYFTIPEELDGFNLSAVHARVVTAGTTGTTDIQIHNLTDTADMLSTKLTIDSGETGSDTAATPAVIDTSNDDVATNDLLRIDVDAVSTTPAAGLIVRLQFDHA